VLARLRIVAERVSRLGLQRRSIGPELLDGPLDDPETLQGNLRDLGRVNRWLGGTRLSCRAVDMLLEGADEARILDVGTGAADIPMALIGAARRHGRRWHVTAVDSRAEVIDAARTVTPALLTTPDLVLERADGQSLPYADRAFDIGHASLVIHHLEPAEAVAFLRELMRVSRVGVVVNDLVRSRLTVSTAWLMSHVFTTNRYTRHDAPLSARRSYSRAELHELFDAAGLRVVAEVGGPAGHRRALSGVAA
jgi:ubiquinone/menaquinone biosynthesis C-methylase UbiE